MRILDRTRTTIRPRNALRALLLLHVLLHTSPTQAQLDISSQSRPPVTPTWTQYEFMRYGKVGATLYTGTLTYSLPIFTYHDKDFDIPIAINYATNGFRVNHKSGILGHGWSLAAGGMVTREIRGIPDEQLFAMPNNPEHPNCMFYGYEHATKSPGLKAKVLTIAHAGNYVCTDESETGDPCFIETEPDIYSFDLGEYTGCFEANPDCAKNGYQLFNVSGESRGVQIRSVGNENILMVDPYGVKYKFKSVNKIRKDASGLPASLIDMGDDCCVTTGWLIDSAEAPNGRTVRFHTTPIYNDFSYTVGSSYYNMRIGKPGISDDTKAIRISQNATSYRLDSITFCNSAKMVFIYKAGETEYDTRMTNNPGPAQGDQSRLSEIRIFRYGHLVKNCRFEYECTERTGQNSNSATFLKSVSVSGEGAYLFEYDQSVPVPLLGTTSFDHWGYYNNATDTPYNPQTLFGIEENALTYEETGAEKYRAPNFSTAKLGTLKRIVYPTGGYSEFHYEPHTYSQQVLRSAATLFAPRLTLLDGEREAGGVRIKTIVTNPCTEGAPPDTVMYDYSDPGLHLPSSGILTDTPRYGVAYTATSEKDGSKSVLHYSLGRRLFDAGHTHIEYAHVSERKTGEGVTDYFYTTTRDYRDKFYDAIADRAYDISVPTWPSTFDGQASVPIYFSNHSTALSNILSPVCSMQHMRGRLKRADYHMADGTLQKSVETKWSFPVVKTDTVLTVVGETARWLAINREDIDKISSTQREYSNDTAFTDRELYSYNPKGMVCQLEKEGSDGSRHITTTLYVGDRQPLDDTVKKMVAGNMTACKTEEREVCTRDGEAHTVRGERYTYTLPSATHPYMACVGRAESLNADQTWQTVATFLYDAHGNITEYNDAMAIPTSFVWGWDCQRQLASAANVPSTTLRTALSAAGIPSTDALAASTSIGDDIYTALGTLYTRLPQAYVTLYRYQPQYGLSGVTSPDGLTKTFGYDSSGRLRETRNHSGRLTNQYIYHTVTVKPIEVSITAPGNCYIGDSATFNANVSGSNGLYTYKWTVRNASGHTLGHISDNTPQLCMAFLADRYKAGCYFVVCEVSDALSSETSKAETVIYLSHRPVCYNNAYEYDQIDEGHGVAGAYINVPTATTLTLSFSCHTDGICTLTIDGETYTYTGHHDNMSIVVPTTQPSAGVSMEIEKAATESTAKLSIVSAEGLTVGNPCVLSLDVK